MFRWLNLLLLLLFFDCHEGTDTEPVSGKKGGKATFTCVLDDKKILHFDLSSETNNIDVCQTEECGGRVFQEGSCVVIIKDLTFSDAGKYFLHVYYNNDQEEVERQIRMYHLQIHDEISVKTGEQLKMDVLPSNADKVEKNSSGEWTEVWTRGRGFQSDRLTRTEGNLTIKVFTSSDSGTYRVLDSDGETLVTVTVTESRTGSKEKQDEINDDRPVDSEHKHWILLVLLVAGVVPLIIFAVWKFRRPHNNSKTQELKKSRNKNTKHDSCQEIPLQKKKTEPQKSNGSLVVRLY